MGNGIKGEKRGEGKVLKGKKRKKKEEREKY